MNKLLIALLAGLFSTAVFAQATATNTTTPAHTPGQAVDKAAANTKNAVQGATNGTSTAGAKADKATAKHDTHGTDMTDKATTRADGTKVTATEPKMTPGEVLSGAADNAKSTAKKVTKKTRKVAAKADDKMEHAADKAADKTEKTMDKAEAKTEKTTHKAAVKTDKAAAKADTAVVTSNEKKAGTK